MAQPRARLLSPTAIARRNAIYKGVLGGDRKWVYIGGAFWIARTIRRTIMRSEKLVTIERLEPGQWMSLRTIPMASRSDRKAEKASRPS